MNAPTQHTSDIDEQTVLEYQRQGLAKQLYSRGETYQGHSLPVGAERRQGGAVSLQGLRLGLCIGAADRYYIYRDRRSRYHDIFSIYRLSRYIASPASAASPRVQRASARRRSKLAVRAKSAPPGWRGGPAGGAAGGRKFGAFSLHFQSKCYQSCPQDRYRTSCLLGVSTKT